MYSAPKIDLFNYPGIFCGVSGALYAQFQEFIATSVIDLVMSTNVLFMAYIGGTRLFLGPHYWVGDFRLPFRISEQLHGPVGVDPGYRFSSFSSSLPPRESWESPGRKSKGGEMAEAGRKTENTFLELQGIYKDFDGLEVLFGISLGIQEGERHAIIGPNGAGKSTIFNLITGKYCPSKGRIFFPRAGSLPGPQSFQA